jgi:hypothetical protein
MKDLVFTAISSQFKEGIVFTFKEINGTLFSKEDLKVGLSRLVKERRLQRLSYSVYYLPSPNANPLALSQEAIAKRYLGTEKNPIGFYCLEAFMDSVLGDPLPTTRIDIMSNKITSGKKVVFQNGRRVTLRKPYLKIDPSNLSFNSLLAYLTMANTKDLERNLPALANYVRKEHLSAIDALVYLPSFPAKTSKRLLSTGLYKILWHH